MKVLIRPLREDADVGAILREHGWAVTGGKDGVLSASHRDVPDEETARSRLESLGLLITTSVHIDFDRDDG
jgi:hypothetical protein